MGKDEKGDKNREDGGTDRATGSQVNDAFCPTCGVWYNSASDAQVNAHAGH